MRFVPFDPLKHYAGVVALWEKAMGTNYPVTDRVLRPRIWTRSSYEPGDGVVVLEGKRLAGFGIAELDRAALCHGNGAASIQAIVVHPSCQRRGIGRRILGRLEERLGAQGVNKLTVSMSLWRFWSGIHDDLPAARAFFERHDYKRNYDAIDMYGSLAHFKPGPRHRRTLERSGVTIRPSAAADLAGIYALLTREAAGWRDSLIKMAAYGDIGNILAVLRGEEYIGCIQTFTPQSRFRSANLVWERLLGKNLGGMGAVLIAKAWRGKGLGVCMIEAAAQHLKDHGASGCFVDWTSRNLAPFYGKVGTTIWRSSGMYGKDN